MKRLPLLIAAAVAASATGLVFAITGSAKPPAQGRVIHVIERQVQETFVDNPPKNKTSQGDEFVFRGKLFDTSGKRVGSDGVSCLLLQVTRKRQTANCTAAIFLPDGKISVVGGVHFHGGAQTFTLPVVGGTGAYVGAQGTLVIKQLNSNKSDLTITLTG
jgi:hypothetical protein